jgi:hypothetical protein
MTKGRMETSKGNESSDNGDGESGKGSSMGKESSGRCIQEEEGSSDRGRLIHEVQLSGTIVCQRNNCYVGGIELHQE